MIAARTHLVGFVLALCALLLNGASFVGNVTRIPDEPGLRVMLATFQFICAVAMFFIARHGWRSLRHARLREAMNVRIERGDEQLKCDIVYIGVRDELHTWVIIDPPICEGDRLMLDQLPARTAIIGL